jgi:hypothetical protein
VDKNQYFGELTAVELAAHLSERFDTNEKRTSSSRERKLKSLKLYYGQHYNSSDLGDGSILSGGNEGELKLVTVNHYRNLIKHVHVMTTNQKPSFDVRAINSDNQSLQQARLGNNILDAYLKEKRLGRYLKAAAEHALVVTEGFVKCVWEPSLGRQHTVEQRETEGGEVTSRVVYEGDVELSTPTTFDIDYDRTAPDWTKVEWVNIRSFKNKWNLAKRYPEQDETIRALQTKDGQQENGRTFFTLHDLDETADVPVFEFYHKRTDALPNGRYTLFCENGVVLYDGPIPYEQIPLFRISAGDVIGSTECYSDAFDLIGITEVYNTLYSTAFTNQQAFGVQSIWLPQGCEMSTEAINDNLVIFRGGAPGTKPEALQLTSTAPEIFQMLELTERHHETLSGINSVARGNPESSLKSGVALGLVQSMAVQYASGFQQSWAELLEDCGTFILKLLKHFAKTQRMVAMAGKHNRGNMAEFTGSDLDGIDRVIVDLGNPMARTTAGRLELANGLLDKGLIKTPQEYFSVLNTGNLDPITEGPEAENSLIRKENEELMDGKPVQALVFDSHVLHMQEHKAILANPEVRRNGQTVQNTLAHIQEHMQLWKNQDPAFGLISGEPPAPMPMMAPPPGAPMGPPPGPQGAPMPAPPDQMAPGPMPAPVPPEMQAPQILQPPVM